MDNKWLRLALISFVGILLSTLGLFLVQSIGGAMNANTMQNHGGTDQMVMISPDRTGHTGSNHGQGMTQSVSPVPVQYAPQFPMRQPGMGYVNSPMYGNNPMAYQMYLMRQQINQLRYQLNNMNNMNNTNNMSNMSNMNNSGGGMGSMPLM